MAGFKSIMDQANAGMGLTPDDMKDLEAKAKTSFLTDGDADAWTFLNKYDPVQARALAIQVSYNSALFPKASSLLYATGNTNTGNPTQGPTSGGSTNSQGQTTTTAPSSTTPTANANTTIGNGSATPNYAGGYKDPTPSTNALGTPQYGLPNQAGYAEIYQDPIQAWTNFMGNNGGTSWLTEPTNANASNFIKSMPWIYSLGQVNSGQPDNAAGFQNYMNSFIPKYLGPETAQQAASGSGGAFTYKDWDNMLNQLQSGTAPAGLNGDNTTSVSDQWQNISDLLVGASYLVMTPAQQESLMNDFKQKQLDYQAYVNSSGGQAVTPMEFLSKTGFWAAHAI